MIVAQTDRIIKKLERMPSIVKSPLLDLRHMKMKAMTYKTRTELHLSLSFA